MRLTLLQLLELSTLVVALAAGSQADPIFVETRRASSSVGEEVVTSNSVPAGFQEQAEPDGSRELQPLVLPLRLDDGGGVEFNDALMDLKRQSATSLDADTPMSQGIAPGDSAIYVFPSTIQSRSQRRDEDAEPLHENELRKRQDTSDTARTVYVSINTCQQPQFETTMNTLAPPQLTLSFSSTVQGVTTSSISLRTDRVTISLAEGFATYNTTTADDLYIAVHAPQVAVMEGTWNYQVAASVEAPFHSWVNQTESNTMVLIDSDSTAALLITNGNITKFAPDWYDGKTLPFSVAIQNTNNSEINGIRRSYCGLERYAQIVPTSSGIESFQSHYFYQSTEQQMYVPNLNASSNYTAFLAKTPSANIPAVGGGGIIYSGFTFLTKRFSNCRIIYNLEFCDTIAYAVPSNPDLFSTAAALASIYDNDAAQKYKGFNYSLQQIPCNTTASAQYSLAKTCDDCATAYKQWLCAVTIPRCADWTSDPIGAGEPYLQPRNAAQKPLPSTPDILQPTHNATLMGWWATNSTRNPALINEQINSGPYSEIMPCADLCHELVRACPASFGFGCPQQNQGLNRSYGVYERADNGCLSCSEPGAVCGRNGVGKLGVNTALILGMVGAVVGWLL